MHRGNRGMTVFTEERHCRLFLDKLAAFADAYRVEVRAYCLMGNHFHLYLCTPEGNLSRFMQAFLTSFTLLNNRLLRERGHLFQGRFKALLVEDEAYGSTVGRYIHLNPNGGGHTYYLQLIAGVIGWRGDVQGVAVHRRAWVRGRSHRWLDRCDWSILGHATMSCIVATGG